MPRMDSSRVLHIDLSKRIHWVEDIPSWKQKKHLGGRGLASYLLFRELKKDCDPLGPDNILVFAPGLFTGTNVPTAGRTTVVGKSPATGLFMKSSMGGHWGAEFRYSGYDLLVIHGQAPQWTNLKITDTDVQFYNAREYLGLDTRETTKKFIEEVKQAGLSVACIGPAGENLVKIAGIMCDIYHTAARGGLGAVMGSKKLKAIGVTGRSGLEIQDPATFLDVAQLASESIAQTGRCQFYKEYGTAGVIMGVNESEALPSKNYQFGHLKEAYEISGQCLTEKHYLVRRESCFACTISCKRYTRTKINFPGSHSGGPEYETLGSFGCACLVPNMDVNLRANELCNTLGLDSISTGCAIAWAMETAENGLLPRNMIDPLTGREYCLEWGNAEAMLFLVEMIAYRRGLGDLLAEGIKRASEKVGQDSWKWAVQAKGLEMSNVETRNAKAYSLAFATNPRGPDHLYGQPMAEFGFSPEGRAVVKKIAGDEKYAVPTITDKKPEIVVWHENVFAMTDALGVCSRATLSTYAITVEMLVKLFQAASGIPITEEEIHTAAERIINLERSFNIREGTDRTQDILPWRIMHNPLRNSKGEEAVNSPEELQYMLDHYYRLRDWDLMGKPKTEKLKALGISLVLEDQEI